MSVVFAADLTKTAVQVLDHQPTSTPSPQQ